MVRSTVSIAVLLALASPLSAQSIAPCVAITGVDSTHAERCIPVPTPPDTTPTPPPDTLPTPPDTSGVTWAASVARWVPEPGQCSQAIHDSYAVIGPDGKKYPTWHPPVDPSGCQFGHEHGDNPATSEITDLPATMFGYTNEQAYNGPGPAIGGDHVGHKVFVVNNFVFTPTAAAEAKVPIGPVTCDVVAMLHQGTHGAGAFTINLHEQTTSIRCENGFAFDLRLLSAIGAPGTITAQCTSKVQVTGDPKPANSPTSSPQNPGGSMGHRFMPTDECVEALRPRFTEVWKTQNVIKGVDGKNAARFAWYWNVGDPSRYWSPEGLKHTVDQCYRMVSGVYQTINDPCRRLRNDYPGEQVRWNDTRSPFKGVNRSVRLNDFQMYNANGPEVFYTDALGQISSLAPFPGSVRQYVRRGYYPYPLNGNDSPGGNFDAPGVHAPN